MRTGYTWPLMKEIQCASSLETVPEGSAMSTSYSKWSACLSRLFFSFLFSSQTGSWSHMVSDSQGRQRKGDLGYKSSIDQTRQKHNCAKLQKNKQFFHHIFGAATLMDILTSYQTHCIYFSDRFPYNLFQIILAQKNTFFFFSKIGDHQGTAQEHM